MSFSTYVWDLETTDLTTFMGRVIVASFLDMGSGKVQSSTIFDHGPLGTARRVDAAERKLVGWVLDHIERADVLVGHNSKAFDCNFLRGRMASLEIADRLPKRVHLDTYLIARYAFKGLPQGYSLDNLAEFFRLIEKKDKPPKYDWANSTILDEPAIRRIRRRCESDVRVTGMLWEKLRPYYFEWRGS